MLNEPTEQMWIFALISPFIANFCLYIFCQTCGKRDNSWVDAMWGIMFCLPNAVLLAMRGADDITPRMWLISVPVFLWGVRLAVYILIRHKSEDYRYKEMRLGWEAKGDCFYYFAAFMFVAVMQALFSLITNSSVIFVNLYSSVYDSPPLGWSDYVGVAMWALGFLIEVASDSQLATHLKSPKPGAGKFCKEGFWRYSRHPNYFGEAVMWWGLFVIALAEEYGWATFYSALFINLCIRFLSGVPFGEKKYKENPEWQQYCRETNVFCLWRYVKVEQTMISGS